MMGAESNIEWTDATWPIVQGCDYESPGCTHCYVVPLLWRLSHNPLAKVSGPIQGLVAKSKAGVLHFTGKVALRHDRLADPLGWKKPRMIFVPSHGDVFHPAVPDDFIARIFATMGLTPWHTYQLLTKRSQRAQQLLSSPAFVEQVKAAMWEISEHRTDHLHGGWPLANVWLGASTEDQKRFDERWPHLRDTPAAKRFISYEPALGPLDPTDLCNGWYFEDALAGRRWHDAPEGENGASMAVPRLDWVIAGLESGGKARAGDIAWLRQIVRLCLRAGVPVFVKQLGRRPYDSSVATPDPLIRASVVLEDRKGGDMDEWPEDLRVRQFPPGFARAATQQPGALESA